MKSILIIEDDRSIAELEQDYLEISGFQTEIASTGTEGLELALNKEFDFLNSNKVIILFINQISDNLYTLFEIYTLINKAVKIKDSTY